MAQGPDGKTIIIVKKVSGHGGHHGGAWKVAYADFVTSMMAFFMVLWLVNSASITVRERIASYFRAPGVFEKGSGTPLETGGAGILSDTFAPPADRDSQVQPNPKIYEVPDDEGLKRDTFGDGGGEGAQAQGSPKEKEALELLAQEIEKAVQEDAQTIVGFIGKIEVKIDQRGLHLEIMDTPTASMFQRGSAAMQPEAEKELGKIADILKKFPNPIDIEGHTDAAPFRGKVAANYDNWNLSTDRANAARRVLSSAGMESKRIARVVGYADQRLKMPKDPLAPSNRRISISMRFTTQAKKILERTHAVETQAVPIGGQPKGEGTKSQKSGKEPVPGEGSPGLKMEVRTSQPEQGVLGETPEEDNARPAWMEKDKIFDKKNPFFGD